MSARYTVKQVAELVGVSPATVRAWERRYAVVSPQRSTSRYRLYDEEEVRRLRAMGDLVREGHPASLAAEEVKSGSDQAAPKDASAGDRTAPPPETPTQAPPGTEDLIRAASSLDTALLSRVLDEGWATGSLETVLDHWLAPAMVALGDAWEDGRVDVAGEHFVSAGVHGRLAAAYEAAGARAGAPVVLTGLPPGAHHQLGALAFSACARRQGLDVVYLGPDVPEDSWLHATASLLPAAVVVSVPLDADVAATASLCRRLASEHPKVTVRFGGFASGAVAAELGSEGDREMHLSGSAVTSAQLLATELGEG